MENHLGYWLRRGDLGTRNSFWQALGPEHLS